MGTYLENRACCNKPYSILSLSRVSNENALLKCFGCLILRVERCTDLHHQHQQQWQESARQQHTPKSLHECISTEFHFTAVFYNSTATHIALSTISTVVLTICTEIL